MAENKTTENDAPVESFLATVDIPKRVEAARKVMTIMARVTGETPRMWGTSIIGYDRYDYTRKDGSEHSFMITGLSPRKANLAVYIMPGFSGYGDLMDKLGPHKTGRSCLYLTKMDQVDMSVLEELIARSVRDMRAKYC